MANTQLTQTIDLELSNDLKNYGQQEVESYLFNKTGMVLILGLRNTSSGADESSSVVGFNLFRSEEKAKKPIWKINVSSSVMSLSLHPRKSTILAVGLQSGSIEIHDISRADGSTLLCRSDVSELFHTQAVSSLKWCIYKVNQSYKIILGSCSRDGKLLLWDMSNKLKFPTRGYLVSKEKNEGNHILISGKRVSLKHQGTRCSSTRRRRTSSWL